MINYSELKDNMKELLPKIIGKNFRDISGKGPERIYIDLIANDIAVYVTGYITSGLVNSKLFEDPSMRKATETYYGKLAKNSLDSVSQAVLQESGVGLNSVMCDFNVRDNTGIILYSSDKILAKEDDSDRISGSYHNFVRNRVSEFMINSTGAYPRNIDLYLLDGDLYIFLNGFLGPFNETKYRFDQELIEANRAFYYGILKSEFTANMDDFSTDDHIFCDAFCDVDIMNDRAMIILKRRR